MGAMVKEATQRILAPALLSAENHQHTGVITLMKNLNTTPLLVATLATSIASAFPSFFDRLMKHEGGYVDHPNDPGGETMWGVTKRVARAHGYAGNMRNLPKATAERIAEKSYWQAINGDELPRAVAWQVVDAAYNHGNRQAVKFLQRAVGASADGLIGQRTLAAVGAMNENDILLLFNAERLEFFTNLRIWQTFGKGWARRIAKNLRWAAQDNE